MKRLLAFVALAILAALAWTSAARAQTDDTVINKFHAKYELSNDRHAGEMQVTETLEVTFTQNVEKHGILRAIPRTYEGTSVWLDVDSVKRDGQDEPYGSYEENGNEVLKIGDGGRDVRGQTHTYEIKYSVRNYVKFSETYDELFWDVNGDQSAHSFTEVSGEVVMPAGWSVEGIPGAACYTGSFGSTKSICSINRTETGYTFKSNAPLGPNETLSIFVPFQKALFLPRDKTDWYRDNIWQFVGIVAGIGLSGFALRQWQKWGRDYKGRGTIIPEYDPPKNLTPAEVGLLADYNVDSRDLTATIIDLALKGYIKIIDEEKKNLGIFKSREFTLELTKDSIGGLKAHEKKLLEALFSPLKAGSKIKIKDIDKTKMYNAVTEIRKGLKDTLTKEHGLLEESPTRAYVLLGSVIAVALVLALIFRKWGWIAGMSLASLTALACIFVMHRRSHAGVKEYEKIQGLKLYMDTAEKDRLKMLQSVERPYAEPTHDVHLFEKLLPFAVALGVEKSWAKQFDNIYSEPPGWYSGNMSTFNTVYFTSSLASSVSSFNSSFSAPTSSSSSGASGSGFAGGGAGGGGVGSW